MQIYLLYIDPGTGSALFSIIIGIAAAAFFTFQALFIKVKVLFTGGRVKTNSNAKSKETNKFVIYAEDKRYWTLFKPILEEFENRRIGLLYLTSSGDDPVFDAGFRYVKSELLGNGNKAFARLNLLSADFVLSTTPGLGVYQWKRSKMVKHYCHILHSPVLSTYELFGIDYFDSILVSSSEIDRVFIRKIEKARNLPEKEIVTVGCPYLDEFAKKLNQIPVTENASFTVLVSPSWGKSSLLSRFGEKLLDPLVKTGWRIIVRPHPQSLTAEKEMIHRLSKNYESNSNLEWDFERENIYSLKKADAMISDFSGIILDYMFLCNKPVFFVPQKIDLRTYDEIEIYNAQDEMWLFQTLKKAGIELDPDSLKDLPSLLVKASSDTKLNEAINEARSEVWNHQGVSGKNAADFMICKAERLNA